MKKTIMFSGIIIFSYIFSLSVSAVDYSYIYENADLAVKEYISAEDIVDGAGLIKQLTPQNMFDFIKKSFIGTFPSLRPILENIIFIISASAIALLINDKNFLSVYDVVIAIITIYLLHRCLYPILSGSFVKLASLNVFLSAVYSYMTAGLALGSKNVSAGIMPSVIVGILSLISNVISVFFVPCLNGLLSVTYASSIENGILNKIFISFKKCIISLIGIAGIVFSGVTGLQKCIASAGDSIGLSAAKYIISGSMPIVGGVVKEVFGTVVASSKMIVSASGVFGIIAVVIMLLPHLLKLILTLTLLRLGVFLCDDTGQSSVKSVFRGCTGIFEIVTALYVCEMMYVIISISLFISAA